MKKQGSHFILCLFCLLLISCSTVHLTSGGFEHPAGMNAIVNEEYWVVKHFSIKTKGWFTLAGLYTVKDTDVQTILRNELKPVKGDEIVNIKIKGQTTILDGLLPIGVYYVISSFASISPVASIAIYILMPSSRTYTIEGDVIRYRTHASEGTGKQSNAKDMYYNPDFTTPTVQRTKYYDIIKIVKSYCIIKVTNPSEFYIGQTFEIVRGNASNYSTVGKGKVASIKGDTVALKIINGRIRVNDKIKYKR